MSNGRVSLLARRVQLRLKVMAGVVVVTLVALVAFDVGVVTTMRRYLLGQTDGNLQVALDWTAPRLDSLLCPGPGCGRHTPTQIPPGQLGQVSQPPGYRVPGLPGSLGLAFLPLHGGIETLQRAVYGRGHEWTISLTAAQVAARPGAHTVGDPNGRTQFYVRSLRVPGGHLVADASLDQVTTTIDQVELIVALGSVALVLLIGLGVFVVLRRGLRPIEAMASQAERITGGDLTDRVTPHNPRSEVGRLGAALNDMLARIEADVYEREASQQQMRRFFADASHELRTPLASLRANAELYQQGALSGPDEVAEVMERIVLETRRMGRLVDDMLRLARLGQHPDRSREPVDVTAVVAGCAERAAVADPARTWRVRIADGLTTVGDEELVRRAVDNLLMNVLVHTAPGTEGTITASAADGRLTIEVGDDGPGVAPDKLPHIFERFYRAGAPSRRPGLRSRARDRRGDRHRARRERARRAGHPARPPDHADPARPAAFGSARRARACRQPRLSPVVRPGPPCPSLPPPSAESRSEDSGSGSQCGAGRRRTIGWLAWPTVRIPWRTS
jgi:two-component system, OmpR family, sensor kinase